MLGGGGGWGQLQSLIREKIGRSPHPLESEEQSYARQHSSSDSSRLPPMSASGTLARAVTERSPRGSAFSRVASRAASPEDFARAVSDHNERISRAGDTPSSVGSNFGEQSPEPDGELGTNEDRRMHNSLLEVVQRGRGSGLLPDVSPDPLAQAAHAPHAAPVRASVANGVSHAQLSSLMNMVKLKNVTVPKLAANARLKNKKRSSRGSFDPMTSGSRSTLVPTSLHSSNHRASQAVPLPPSFATGETSSAVLNRELTIPAEHRASEEKGPGVARVTSSPVDGPVHTSSQILPGGTPAGGMSISTTVKVKRAGRLFLRLTGPGARTGFLKAHPFFQGASSSLIERLAPQLVRRSVEQVTSDVLRQGEQPNGATDYLFLTSPDFAANIEVTLDSNTIAALSGDAVFGQEAIFGITKGFLFGIKCPTDVVNTLWVIPRKTLRGLLAKDVYQKDAHLLKNRAHATAVSLLRAWYLHPIAHVKIRLFDNAEHIFKRRLVQVVDMRLVASGENLCSEQEAWSSCICIFRGEACAKIGSANLVRLAHLPGTSAWAAWWCTLEVLGICDKCPASVVASSDCIVWQLSREMLQKLRQEYPMECRLFDKVAVEHMKTLQPYAMKIADSGQLKSCKREFLQELDQHCENRVYKAGELIIREGDVGGKEIYVLVRGKAEVRKSLGGVFPRSKTPSGPQERYTASPCLSSDTALTTVPVASLAEGVMFGELVALGVKERRTATIACSTICDVRVLKADQMVQALMKYPEQGTQLEKLSDYMTNADDEEEVSSDKLAADGMLTDFTNDLLEKMSMHMTSLVAFSGQPIIEQGVEVRAMFALMRGKAAIEIEDARICEIKAPAILGETCLLREGSSSLWTVRSRSHCHFRLITPDRGRELLEQFPEDRERLEKFSAQKQESLRETICNKFHGMRLSSIVEKQARSTSGTQDSVRNNVDQPHEDSSEESDAESPPEWWTDTIFKESNSTFIDFLSGNLHKLVYFHDEVILREGDEGDCAIILQVGHGTVEVGGVRVGEVKAGSIVGEAVLLGYSHVRTATVRAVGLCSAVSLSRDAVLKALAQHPDEMQRIESLMMLRSSTNKMLTSSSPVSKGPGGKSSFSVAGISMGGSAVKTMKMMAQRRSTKKLEPSQLPGAMSPDESSRRASNSDIPKRSSRARTLLGNLDLSRGGSRVGSRVGSRAGSRCGSRVGSRVGSRRGSRHTTPVAALRVGSRCGSPTGGSRAGSRIGSRCGSTCISPALSAAESRLGSTSSESLEEEFRAGSRIQSLRGGKTAHSIAAFSLSPRASLDMTNMRKGLPSHRVTEGAAPVLRSDLRVAERKMKEMKKQAPSIIFTNQDADVEDASGTEGAMHTKDTEDEQRNATIAGIAEQLLRAPTSKSATPEPTGPVKPRSRHESLLHLEGSYTSLSLKVGHITKTEMPPMPLASPRHTIAIPDMHSLPDVTENTDVDMEPGDLISDGSHNLSSIKEKQSVVHRRRATDSQLSSWSERKSEMSGMSNSPRPDPAEDQISEGSQTSDAESDIGDDVVHQDNIFNETTVTLTDPMHKSGSAEWLNKRQKMIDAAPIRQACRLAQRGNFLPLVPVDKSYQGDGPMLQSAAAKKAARTRCMVPSGSSRRLLRAQGVYLRARRFDVRRR